MPPLPLPWRAHQLTPGPVEGAILLAESLAWYSRMLVVEEVFGSEDLYRRREMMRDQYFGPHQPRTVRAVARR